MVAVMDDPAAGWCVSKADGQRPHLAAAEVRGCGPQRSPLIDAQRAYVDRR
jgi:hypothetical protein